MNIFSQKSDSENQQAGKITPDILRAVRIMGDTFRETAPNGTRESRPIAGAPHAQSPFLNRPLNKNNPVPQSFFTGETPHIALEEKGDKKRKKLLFILVGISIVVLIGGGLAWYFMPSPVEDEEVIVPSPTTEISISAVSDTPMLPYALDMPNYLSLDIETITLGDLQGILRQVADRILSASINAPIEFLLTDKNNNPIAFSRFVYLMKIDLPTDLVASLGEPFSLFLSHNAGKVSFGLKLHLSDVALAQEHIANQESELPYAFRDLLFDTIPIPKKTAFRSGAYNTYVVRFVNIDPAQNISFDYAIRDDEWFIGTNKEVLRILLDTQEEKQSE